MTTLIELRKVILSEHRGSAAWNAVERLADELLADLNQSEVAERIANANQPGRSSALVQEAFKPSAMALGFSSEKSGLFTDSISGLRPDYHMEVSGVGVILEVERGKTTINNMDLLDFWKCHICPSASFLFLLVPKALRQNEVMKPRNEFETVTRRLRQFFEPGNGTNVHGLCLYGY